MHDDTHLIHQLLATYCHRVDRGSPEQVAALFAPEAVLCPRFDGDYEVVGREAIRGWYAHYNEHVRAGTRHLKHMIHSTTIEMDGERAATACYFSCCLIGNGDDKGCLVYGTYSDMLARQQGGWLFARRTIETHLVLPGLIAVERFPSMGYAAGR